MGNDVDPDGVRGALDLIRRRVLEAVDPRRLVESALDGVGSPDAIIAVGKAAMGMHAGAVARFGPLPSFMITTEGAAGPDQAPEWAIIADHPVPTARNVEASRALEAFVRSRARQGARLLALISGGASALLASPADWLTIDDLREATQRLLASGATIHEINTVRKHVERLKGGRLALVAAPAAVEALIISDVIGDDPAVIGSGPLSPDPSTYADALEVVERRGLGNLAVRGHLERGARGEIHETPKPGHAAFDLVTTRVIAGNGTAVASAAKACERMGLRATAHQLDGEAADAGRRIAERLLSAPTGSALNSALIWGGETTVTLGGSSGVVGVAGRAGRGGRNQELALSAAIHLAGAEGVALMALATDGVDGPTDAAGAVVTGRTAQQAKALGLDPAEHLRRHDSYPLLERVGALIRTGPTGSNVADLVVALRS